MPNPDQDRHADTVIRSHVLFSMASGAIPIAFADLAAVSAVQLDMVRNLCEVYQVDFSTKRGKALVSSITTAALARAGAASLVKLVPVAGTLIGSVTGGVLAGASSYGLGQAFKTHLSAGGTFLDLDVDRLKRIYREQFEKGKETVKQWGSEASDIATEMAEQGSAFNFEAMVRRRKDAADTSETAGEGTSVASTTPDAPPREVRSTTGSLSARLEELRALRAKGLISEEDYDATKQRLLADI